MHQDISATKANANTKVYALYIYPNTYLRADIPHMDQCDRSKSHTRAQHTHGIHMVEWCIRNGEYVYSWENDPYRRTERWAHGLRGTRRAGRAACGGQPHESCRHSYGEWIGRRTRDGGRTPCGVRPHESYRHSYGEWIGRRARCARNGGRTACGVNYTYMRSTSHETRTQAHKYNSTSRDVSNDTTTPT